MNRIAPRPLAAAIVSLLLTLCATSCIAPLAPGYQILKESREVRFVPGPTPELQIHSTYTLLNSGTTSLSFIDVVFPDEKLYGRKNLRVQLDGREATPAQLPEEYRQESPEALRIALDPPWERKQKRDLIIDYSFSSPADLGSRITLGPDDFHLGHRGWIPLPQPPKRVLAPYPARPPKMSYAIRVPENFLVLARGKLAGRKKDGNEVVYRFDLGKDDLSPYVVAGRYQDSSSASKSSDVSFWTLQPLKDEPASAAQRINAAWSTLQSAFGPLDKNIAQPHIVESPELRAHGDDEDAAAVAAFPGGALVGTKALALGWQSDELIEKITHALAHSWFGDQMYPAANAEVGLGEGLPDYATVVGDEAQGGEPARRKRILELLHIYDEAVQQAAVTPNPEKPIIDVTPYDPILQRRIARAKAALFFTSLEDAYGATNVRHALTQVVALLGGKDVGYDDIRSALEQSTGKDLAVPFRTWLYNKGLPQDFRNQYENGN
ncbi:MAG: M1 family aminopeptidase [Candidatus Acidiferrales bacterium]